jgi:hypothetical protein
VDQNVNWFLAIYAVHYVHSVHVVHPRRGPARPHS